MPDHTSEFGPSITPPRDSDIKPGAAPIFIIGADDRPLDNRIVALSIGVRAELKVGDRQFSSPILLHEVVILRHYYEARAGSGQVRITGAWAPGVPRTRSLTHADLLAEVRRLSETFVVHRAGGQVIKTFELFFGAEPSEQIRRLHAVMREQYEAWNKLCAVAMGRLPMDTAALHPEIRKSMASELITEREMDQIALIADPSRRGLETIELDEIKPADIAPTPLAAPLSLEALKAAAEADADAEAHSAGASRGEIIAERLKASGLDEQRALAVGVLVEEFGDDVSDEALVKAVGSKQKAAQVRPLLKG